MSGNIVDDLPIIIYHLGNQEYVKIGLLQAIKNNKTVILITNTTEFKDLPITVVDANKYSKYLTPLQKMYKHFSTNPPQLEFLCVYRWFVVYEYMKETGIKRAFLCDSDVLIYENLTEINNKFLHLYDYMLCSSDAKNVTGGQSVWNLSELEKFIMYSIRFYQTQIPNIEVWHKTYTDAGGVCDMTLLYYFAHRDKTDKFVGLQLPGYPMIENDLTQVFTTGEDKTTFDLHLLTQGNHPYPDDYETEPTSGNKNIKFKDGKPYCYNKRLGCDVRFILLHFQGRNKRIMKDVYLRNAE
jgi:hypothetical protein